LIVLEDFFKSVSFFIVEDYADDSEKDGLDDFENEIHRLSESVDTCSLENRPKLSAPASLNFLIDDNFLGNLGPHVSLNLLTVLSIADN